MGMSNNTMSSGQPSGGKGNVTTPATSGQPSFGQPNQYPNTVGWDNASIGSQANGQSGKGGKGQSNWQPYSANWTPPDTGNLYPQDTQPQNTQPQYSSVNSSGKSGGVGPSGDGGGYGGYSGPA